MATGQSVEFTNRQSGRVRIISGKWRGRLLTFPATPGLRPTSSRLRETLFSWLGSGLNDSHCLDLFAGSGALGFECLSRGAQHVTFVESHRKTAQALRKSVLTLNAAAQARVISADATRLLRRPTFTTRYNLVLVDPPFQDKVLSRVLPALPDIMLQNSLLYLETSRTGMPPAIPEQFSLLKQKNVGNVCGQLFSYDKKRFEHN